MTNYWTYFAELSSACAFTSDLFRSTRERTEDDRVRHLCPGFTRVRRLRVHLTIIRHYIENTTLHDKTTCSYLLSAWCVYKYISRRENSSFVSFTSLQNYSWSKVFRSMAELPCASSPSDRAMVSACGAISRTVGPSSPTTLITLIKSNTLSGDE